MTALQAGPTVTVRPGTTQFASAERLDNAGVAHQSNYVLSRDLLVRALEAVNELVLVLNAQRQIVFANRKTLALLGAADLKSVLGLRPGEAFGCRRACHAPSGCGTAAGCSVCGAVNAILTAVAGQPDTRECCVLREASGDALDLLVRACPLDVDGQTYTVCSISDISHEKRRHALERIFFHDMINVAGGAMMLAGRVAQGKDGPDDRRRLGAFVTQMVDEIMAQRDLMAAETSELRVEVAPFSVRDLLESLVLQYSNSPVCQNRALIIGGCDDVTAQSDRRLMSRVLGNLIKNALEATPENSTVVVSAASRDNGVEFAVHNEGVIPPAVQMQLFQRSFSTKGTGRGLGTYSIKLLTERYLGGRISLVSNPDDGTIFRVWYPLAITPNAW